MYDLLNSLLLGIVEGLTEFLPVSSTAHLRIAEHLMGIPADDGFWKMYTIVIQLGAVLCLPLYFGPRIAKFLRTFPKGERGDRTVLTHPLTLTMFAFVITAGLSYALLKVVAHNLESFKVIGAALVIGGVIMALVDIWFDKPRTLHVEEMTLPQALWIGFCQTFSAVFPGTSRSMSTIAAGQVAGMSRASALEFSFFLSMPTMAAATVYDFYKTVLSHHHKEGEEALRPVVMDGHRWLVLGIGFVVSFAVALVVVAFFMAWVRRRGFLPFAVWRIVVGLLVLFAALRLGWS